MHCYRTVSDTCRYVICPNINTCLWSYVSSSINSGACNYVFVYK